MSLTFSQYQAEISNLMPKPVSDPDFGGMLSSMIDDAEQRLYRELQLLNTLTTDSSGALTTASRDFNLPSSSGTFVVVERINVITPVGAASPNAGTRNPLAPASREMLDYLWPSSTGSTVPSYFAMRTQTSIIVGPYPDQAYMVEVAGTIRPQVLSSTNVTTLLSWYFPDLLIAASMVWGSGYMKNYGQGVDDPQQGVNWESHLKNLLAAAQTEEAMKKFTSAAWSPKAPAPLATPPRT